MWEVGEQTLAEAQGLCYSVECSSCSHRSTVELSVYIETLGARYKLKDLQRRLVCRCGSRDVQVQLMPWHVARRTLKPRH